MSKNINLIRSVTLRVVLIIAFLFLLVALIAYARGYRLSFEDNNMAPKGITSTGIISVSAFPKASKVYVNGNLKGVTDLNLTLPPGDYKIEVKKEGYTEWTKNLKLKGEIVMTLDALLFPKNPSLLSLTNLGIVKAIPYKESNKIILMSQNNDPEKDGVYLFDAGSNSLSLFAPLKVVILKKYLPTDVDLKDTNVYFSPNSQQAVFEFGTLTGTTYSYLFTLGEEVTQPFDISYSKDTILQSWNAEQNKEVGKILETFPRKLRPIATAAFSVIEFSPDQTKVLYQAKESVDLPLVITPPLIGSNQSTETRTLKKGDIYVYDKKEDKNYYISVGSDMKAPNPSITLIPTPFPTATPYLTASKGILSPTPVLNLYSQQQFPIVWNADSKHIGIQEEKQIVMIDFDGSNKRTIYSGPFEHGFFFITNNGKLDILTNLNPQNNLYADLYEIAIQ